MVMPENASTVPDNHGDFDPWIELLNAGTQDVALANYRLSNDYGDLSRWSFPTGAVIQAGERVVVWADNEGGETTASDWHTNFRLDAGTGSVALTRAWLSRLVLVDHLDYAGTETDHSFGAYPEGSHTNL